VSYRSKYEPIKRARENILDMEIVDNVKDYTFSRRKTKAYCSSQLCYGVSSAPATTGKLKMVARYPSKFCPDCGCVLFWKVDE